MMRQVLRRLLNDPTLYGLVTRVQFSDADIQLAETIIDRSGLADWCDQQLAQTRRTAAGRTRTLTCRTLLVALLALAMAGQAMHLRRCHEVLTRLPRATARRLGIADGVTERQVTYLFNLLADTLDPSEHSQPDLTDDQRADRQARLNHLSDLLLDATLPDTRPERQSYSLDATVLASWGRGWANLARRRDRDAGWSVRSPSGSTAVGVDGGDRKPSRSREVGSFVYGYEVHGLTWVREDDQDKQSVPALTERVRVMKGGVSDVDQVLDALDTITDNVQVADLVSDRWYTQHLPERFHHRIRAAGGQLVQELKGDQRGPAGTWDGALILDGRLHCPATPEGLRNLPKAHWRSLPQMEEQARVAKQRQTWELSPLTARDADGYQRMQCPAEACKARCVLKPESMRLPLSLPTLTEDDIPEHHGKVCQQRSITVPPTVAPRTRQKHAYGTAEWRTSFNRRNVVEGVFGVLKTEGGTGVKRDDIRVMGIAPFTIMVSICVAAANLLLHLRWEQRQPDPADEPGDDQAAPAGTRARRRTPEADLVRTRAGPPGT